MKLELTVSVDKDSAVSDAYVEQCVEIVENLSDADLLGALRGGIPQR